ncbi:STAS domain-containing protein [Mycolicibacterium chlorophenolicum]
MTLSHVFAPSPAGPSGISMASRRRYEHAVRLTCHWPTASVAVISAHGAIDASNAGRMTDHAVAHVSRCRALVLDLRDLNFFGTEGFSALHRVSVSCARIGTRWAVVPGAAVTRVLRVCGPQCSLPTAHTVEAASATFADLPVRPPH